MRIVLQLIWVLLVTVSAATAAEQYDLIRIEGIRSSNELRRLEQQGCVVNGLDRSGWLLVEAPQRVVAELRRDGITVEMLMPDIRGFYAKNAQDYRYHTYTQIKDTFRIIAENNSSFVKLETLGRASNDSILFALKITDNPTIEEDEPELFFEGAIHGDEKAATEALFEFAVYLVQNYGIDPSVTYWVNTREIWILCPGNPYGHINNSRYNANGEDCNRDYGYMWYFETNQSVPFTQPEARLLAELSLRNQFCFWSSGHAGTTMISTPWSYAPYGTRDSMEIQYLAEQYHNITGYDYGPGYRTMYQINGSSKDYAYGAHGAISWTVEVCVYKTPPAESLPAICTREREAMKMVLANVDRGIRGIVTDSLTGQPVRARLRPMPINFPSYCDSLGDYHRYLRPGTYSVVFEANGYRSKTVNGVVVTGDTVTRLDVQLVPDTTEPVTLHRFMAGRGVSDEAIFSTPDWALGRRDGRRFSMGRGGMAIYDFGTQVFNLAGNDFTVYEDDADPEGYRIEVANDWRGPWTVLGWGTGTQGFDLGPVGTCRYVKVVDDSSATSGATAGFDLDAIEAILSNQPALIYHDRVILDSVPGGNGNGRLDPGETADLVLAVKNVGRTGVTGVSATLATADVYVTLVDSVANYGDLLPDSVRWNWTDRFRLQVSPACPREHQASFRLRFHGGYTDSFDFSIGIGAITQYDPQPDSGGTVPLYYAWDDVDIAYPERPTYNWVEIAGVGTRLTLSDDQTVTINLPSAFGPFRFYGQNYTQISVCSNGWVGLGSTTLSTYTNTALPNSSLPPMFCLCWDDLYPPSGGGVWYYHDAPNHRFIVEYDSVPLYRAQTTYQKFQLILYDTTLLAGTNCVAVAQYQIVRDFSSCTVGEQSPSRTIAIQCLFDGTYHRAAAPIAAGRAIRYSEPIVQAVEESPNVSLDRVSRVRAMPNPFLSNVELSVLLPVPTKADVAVFDNNGRLVRTVATGQQPSGEATYRWDGRDDAGRPVTPGVYFCRVRTQATEAWTKLVMAR